MVSNEKKIAESEKSIKIEEYKFGSAQAMSDAVGRVFYEKRVNPSNRGISSEDLTTEAKKEVRNKLLEKLGEAEDVLYRSLIARFLASAALGVTSRALGINALVQLANNSDPNTISSSLKLAQPGSTIQTFVESALRVAQNATLDVLQYTGLPDSAGIPLALAAGSLFTLALSRIGWEGVLKSTDKAEAVRRRIKKAISV